MEDVMRLILILMLALVAAEPAMASRSGAYRKDYCRLWQHRDMQGARMSILNEDSVSFAHNNEQASTGWREVDPNWNDQASSALVPPRCDLIVWEHMEGDGASKTWHGGVNGLNVNYVGDSWNDRISSARCNCAP
jgi:hypothetical protein